MKQLVRMISVAIAGSWALSAPAAVGADEAKQLGAATLTAFGAEKAGNKDGTIPAYTGDPIKVPACYNPKEPGNFCDPWGDKPLYTITAQNMAQYSDRLTEGQKEMLKRYPTYKMDVYASRRTMIYPQYVLDNTIKNATACKAGDGELKLDGCYGGLPFPIPKTGSEVIWNHLVGYTAYAYGGNNRSIVVDVNGKLAIQSSGPVHSAYFIYDPKASKPFSSTDPVKGIRLDTVAPARRSGEKIIVLNYLNNDQRVFQYLPGQRRVKLAPDIAYDTPNPESAGGATMDQNNIFFGQMDRYDFKLVGKTEKYIVYNDFFISDYKRCPAEVFGMKNFPNPICTRWELHRVWHVQATLKPSFRHILPKRDLYFDEDTPTAGTGDSYDAAGKLYRIDNQMWYPFYDKPYGGTNSSTVTIDLQTGTWALQSWPGVQGGGYYHQEAKPATFWSPDGMAGEGIR